MKWTKPQVFNLLENTSEAAENFKNYKFLILCMYLVAFLCIFIKFPVLDFGLAHFTSNFDKLLKY